MVVLPSVQHHDVHSEVNPPVFVSLSLNTQLKPLLYLVRMLSSTTKNPTLGMRLETRLESALSNSTLELMMRLNAWCETDSLLSATPRIVLLKGLVMRA